MTSSDVLSLLRYSAWASKQLVEALRTIPDAAFEENVGVSHGSLRGTLAHIQFADWIWYTRAVGPMDKPGETREDLETGWPKIQQAWEKWAEGVSDADLDRVVEYQTRVYGVIQRKPWQVVMHLVNHATLHRGQVMSMLRQRGITPPGTDFMNYCAELDRLASGT